MYVYPNYYKKVHNYIKKDFSLFIIRMINLSFDELRLIAQIRNISDYENKFKEDLIKALSETKLETPKLETPKQKTLKLETPKSEKPKPEITKPETRVNKEKLKKLRRDFDELRHKFSKREIDIEKVFMLLKTNNIFLNQK